MPGVILYPSKIKNKTSAMNSKLEELKSNINNGKGALNLVTVYNYQLKGDAWDSARSYMEQVQNPLMDTTILWIERQKNENAAYNLAACALPQVACLDQDKLEAEYDTWERKLDREYARENPRGSVIRRCRNMMGQIRDKLNAIDRFVGRTGNIYSRSRDILSVLMRADTEIGKVVFNAYINRLDFSAVDSMWLLELEEGAARAYLMGEKISEGEVDRLKEMGITEQELVVIYNSMETEEDKELFKSILKQNYQAAFQVNPEELSPAASLFLVKYSELLVEKDQIQELERFINGMIYTDEYHSPYPNDMGESAYGAEYLRMMFVTSAYMLDKESTFMFEERSMFTEEGLKKLGEGVKRKSDLNALWGTLGSIAFTNEYYEECGLESISMQLPYGGKVLDLNYGGAGFKFNYEYHEAAISEPTYDICSKNISEIIVHSDNLLNVITILNTNLNEMTYQEYREEIQRLNQELDSYWEKLIVKGSLDVMGAYFTPVEILNGIVGGAMDHSATDVGDNMMSLLEESGLLSTLGVEKYKSGGTAAVSVIGNIIEGISGYQSLKAEKEYEQLKTKMEWFGTLISFEAGDTRGSVNEGFFNPQAIIQLKQWEENGLIALLSDNVNIPEEVKKNLIVKLETELREIGQYTDEVAIVLHGGDIFGIENLDDPKTPKFFYDYVSKIEWAYQNLTEDSKIQFGDKLNIQALLQS